MATNLREKKASMTIGSDPTKKKGQAIVPRKNTEEKKVGLSDVLKAAAQGAIPAFSNAAKAAKNKAKSSNRQNTKIASGAIKSITHSINNPSKKVAKNSTKAQSASKFKGARSGSSASKFKTLPSTTKTTPKTKTLPSTTTTKPKAVPLPKGKVTKKKVY